MTRSLVVLMGAGAVAGTLTRESGGRLRFDYDREYRDMPDATPLSLSMPTQVSSHGHAAVAAWLRGLLPDNEAVLRRWARHFHASMSPFSLLGTPVGEDCPGAVRFVAPDRVDAALRRTGSVEWLSDGEVARRLSDLRSDSTAWLGGGFTGQFSLAGAQSKTALFYEDGRWGQPSGSLPTTHILKPAVAGLNGHNINEHLCLDAASRVGLIAARSRIARFEEETAVVLTRYDRLPGSAKGGVGRVHQEDVCQALGVLPERKYENEGGPGVAAVVRLFRNAMPVREAQDAVGRFVDALIWNWLIAGTDAHAKNYSLLLAGRQVRLAPLYDVASALPYGAHERKLRLAMKIGGDYRVHPFGNPWPAAARDLSLDADVLLSRVRELAAAAPDAFADACKADALAGIDGDLPARLLDLVAGRARRCMKLLGA